MTAPERETAGAVRSANVAHFLPPDWGRIARIVAPSIERLPREGTSTGLLIVVPDPGASVALSRALATIPSASGRRIVAATSASRGRRLLAEAPAEVVIGAPLALAPLLASSTLKLGDVTSVVLAAADDLDPEDPELVALLTEVPRTAGRILTALVATPGVELLLERHMHRARRVQDEPTAPHAVAAPPLRCLTVAGSPLEELPPLLDESDVPPDRIVSADEEVLRDGRALLASLGYREGPLARFTTAAVEANTALVIFLGLPSTAQWLAAVAAQPAQTVAVITPRDRSALEQLAHPAVVRPFVPRSTLAGARAAEARARAELRNVLSEGVPSREVLALEPLLVEHDGLEVAAAALRLLERTRSAQGELVREAERRVRAEVATAPAADVPPRRDDRPPRPFAPKGDRPGRPFSPKGDRPSRPFASKGDRPRGPRRDDDGPRGPRRDDDRPRGPRKDDDRSRGPRGPRGPR